MFVASIVLVSNLTPLVNVNCVVLIVDDTAFLVFLARKYVGLLPDIWNTDISVGFKDPDAEKSTTSSIIKFWLLSKLDVI